MIGEPRRRRNRPSLANVPANNPAARILPEFAHGWMPALYRVVGGHAANGPCRKSALLQAGVADGFRRRHALPRGDLGSCRGAGEPQGRGADCRPVEIPAHSGSSQPRQRRPRHRQDADRPRLRRAQCNRPRHGKAEARPRAFRRGCRGRRRRLDLLFRPRHRGRRRKLSGAGRRRRFFIEGRRSGPGADLRRHGRIEDDRAGNDHVCSMPAAPTRFRRMRCCAGRRRPRPPRSAPADWSRCAVPGHWQTRPRRKIWER